MKFTYLLINFFTILFPVALSFDKRVQFYKSWKFIIPGMLVTGIVFLGWDAFFTSRGIWKFNPDYVIGIYFFQLPLEEILFFLTVPFACLFIYSCLNYYVKWKLSEKAAGVISLLLILLCLFLAIRFPYRVYTSITVSLLAVILFVVQYLVKASWLSRFYRAYVVSLIPFYIVNGILTSIPIVMYNNWETVHMRVGTIPFEDHLYLMALMLMNTAFFEYFKRRWTPSS